MDALTAFPGFEEDEGAALFAPSLRWSGLSSLSGEPAQHQQHLPPAPPVAVPRTSQLSLASDRSWPAIIEFGEDPSALLNLMLDGGDEQVRSRSNSVARPPPAAPREATSSTTASSHHHLVLAPPPLPDRRKSLVVSMDVVDDDEDMEEEEDDDENEDADDPDRPAAKRRATTGTSVAPPAADEDDFYLQVMENDLAAFEQDTMVAQQRLLAMQEELIQRVPLVEDRAELRLGVYTQAEREQRLQHFREKRKQRVYGQVRYKLRQKVSETRQRSKGRFVKQPQQEGGAPPVKHQRVVDTPEDVVMSIDIPKDVEVQQPAPAATPPPPPAQEQPPKKKRSLAFVTMASDMIAMMKSLTINRRRRTIAGTAPSKDAFLGASEAAEAAREAAEAEKRRRKSMPASPYDSMKRRFSFGTARFSTASTAAASSPQNAVTTASAATNMSFATPQSTLTHRGSSAPTPAASASASTPHKPNNGVLSFDDPLASAHAAMYGAASGAATTQAEPGSGGGKRRTMSFVVRGGGGVI